MTEAATKVAVKTVQPPASKPYTEDRPLQTLRRQVDRLFEDFQRGYWHLPFSRTVFDVEPFWRGDIAFGAVPSVDIVEKDDAYKMSAELPGIDEKNIEVKLANGGLTIKGEKQEEKEEKRKGYYLHERQFGSFERCFPVPQGVDTNKIEASFRKGVLTVTLPKKPEAQKPETKIEIKAA